MGKGKLHPFFWGGGVKIFFERESKHSPEPNSHVRVGREIKIYLECIRACPYPCNGSAKRLIPSTKAKVSNFSNWVGQKNFFCKIMQKHAKLCKIVQLKWKWSKNVLLKVFWILFKNLHCRGPCSLMLCISRPYCILTFRIRLEKIRIRIIHLQTKQDLFSLKTHKSMQEFFSFKQHKAVRLKQSVFIQSH